MGNDGRDPPNSLLPRCELFQPEGRWQQAETRHTWHELIQVLGGSYRLVGPGGPITLRAGETLLIPAGCPHAVTVRNLPGNRFHCLQWTSSLDGPIRPVDDPHGRIAFCLRWAWQLSNRLGPGSDPGIVAQLHHLTGLIDHEIEGPAEPTKGDPLDSVINRIHYNLHRPLDVAALAQAIGWTTRRLVTHFKARTGESPSRYIQRCRIEKAVHLLAAGDDPFATIAEQVGYASATHLANLIRRQTGRTPGRWRGGN